MPGQIKSRAQFRMLEARAHANPSKARRQTKGPSAEVAKKMLADNPVKHVSDLPERVGKK